MSEIKTIHAVSARSLETTIRLGASLATSMDETILIVFDSVSVEVDPGDTAEQVAQRFADAEARLLTRLSHHPLLSDRSRTVKVGDLVETQDGDHFTRIPAGSFGLVTETMVSDGRVDRITVRFARRTVDYEAVDFVTLRFAR